MWQESTTPEERLIDAQRELAVRVLLDPEQPGLEPEERLILRHLLDGLEEGDGASRNYTALAAQLSCDPSTVSRKVARLRERLLRLWRLGVTSGRRSSPTAPGHTSEDGDKARAPRVIEPLVEQVIATRISRSRKEAA